MHTVAGGVNDRGRHQHDHMLEVFVLGGLRRRLAIWRGEHLDWSDATDQEGWPSQTVAEALAWRTRKRGRGRVALVRTPLTNTGTSCSGLS